MRTRYLSLSPYNLVRVILGESFDSENDAANVYDRYYVARREQIDVWPIMGGAGAVQR